ncbi:MAG: hypothetical protein EOP52_09865 [Sphingobacteriales bacterium]|nr:MAG: hypothetical protein EOP52_09865 [Sphingobacteriales bacterium]
MLLYLLAASGLLVHAHYCGDELASWNLYEKEAGCGDDGCDKELEATVVMEEDGCCKDKVIQIQALSEQKHAEPAFQPFGVVDGILPLPVFTGLFPEASVPVVHHTVASYKANAPPGRWQNVPLHKLYVRFTYYG